MEWTHPTLHHDPVWVTQVAVVTLQTQHITVRTPASPSALPQLVGMPMDTPVNPLFMNDAGQHQDHCASGA
jgi:hypothetical protein